MAEKSGFGGLKTGGDVVLCVCDANVGLTVDAEGRFVGGEVFSISIRFRVRRSAGGEAGDEGEGAAWKSAKSSSISRCQHVGRAAAKTRTEPSNPVKEGKALLGLAVLVADGALLTGASSKPPRRSTSGSFCCGAAGADTVCVRKEEPTVAEREGALLRETEDLRATVSSSPAVYSSKSRRPLLSLKPPEPPPE